MRPFLRIWRYQGGIAVSILVFHCTHALHQLKKAQLHHGASLPMSMNYQIILYAFIIRIA